MLSVMDVVYLEESFFEKFRVRILEAILAKDYY